MNRGSISNVQTHGFVDTLGSLNGTLPTDLNREESVCLWALRQSQHTTGWKTRVFLGFGETAWGEIAGFVLLVSWNWWKKQSELRWTSICWRCRFLIFPCVSPPFFGPRRKMLAEKNWPHHPGCQIPFKFPIVTQFHQNHSQRLGFWVWPMFDVDVWKCAVPMFFGEKDDSDDEPVDAIGMISTSPNPLFPVAC